jgi:hypothetical protein
LKGKGSCNGKLPLETKHLVAIYMGSSSHETDGVLSEIEIGNNENS